MPSNDLESRLMEHPEFQRALEAVWALREGGWLIRIWDADPHSERLLLVDGRDDGGDAFRGNIDPAGNLRGEPCDPGEEPGWLAEHDQRAAAEDDARGAADR